VFVFPIPENLYDQKSILYIDQVMKSISSPTGCALAAPPPIDGYHIVADTSAEKGTISLDAKRRPLQARVGRSVA
jgi:hypothetical protein